VDLFIIAITVSVYSQPIFIILARTHYQKSA